MKRIILIVLLTLGCAIWDLPAAVDSTSAEKTLWDIMIEALIEVESKGNSQAVGAGNCVGILQLTPTYVKEVNRILKERRFTLNCRKSREKSIAMFEIYQGYYNPTKNINKAIKLHNPGAGQSYLNKVHKIMNNIKNNK